MNKLPDIPRDPPRALVALLLAALVLSVYWQAGGHGSIHLDDDAFVYGNPIVLDGLTAKGAAWAFTTDHGGLWHPLTWLSHMADVSMFGADPGRHHLVSAAIHALNTVLLFLLLQAMTGAFWRSAFVAALFGVHPLHVEPVAWVAERKELLGACFWWLTMAAYLRYARKPCVGRYLPVVLLLALGLMCKPMLVTLPLVLLLADYWPLARGKSVPLSRLAIEKAPLLALSALSAAVTIATQLRSDAVSSLASIPFGPRLANAAISCAAYLLKTAWPDSLAVYYPFPMKAVDGATALKAAGAAALLAAATALIVREARRRPYLAFGWFWYLGTLVPVIGLLHVGGVAMADRYSYIPLTGVFIMIAWGFAEATEALRFRRVLAGILGGAVVIAFAATAWIQTGYWRDASTVFTHALRVTGDNPTAWYNLGLAEYRLGNHEGAIASYRAAIGIRPRYSEAWYGTGLSLRRLRKFPEAVAAFREALRIRPDYPEAWNGLGNAYRDQGLYPPAIDAYRRALALRPELAEAWYNLGAAFAASGRRESAREIHRRLLQLDPREAERFRRMEMTPYRGFRDLPADPNIR
jgi:tetratricopeptide (TPR) repeat protein